MGCRLVQVERLQGRVRVDAVSTETLPGGEPPGWPFTVDLELPGDPWMAVSLTSLLRRWADADTVCRLEVRHHPAASMVVLSDGTSVLRLRVVAAPV